MAMSGGSDDGEPMMEMNTTPLIDVMLVLLIMFIITIPIQTHAVKIDLPNDSANNPPDMIDPVKNKVAIDVAGTITWNGLPIDKLTLRQYLKASMALPVEPVLQFQPDPQTRYVVVDEVLSIIKASKVTKLGFVGNEQYASF
ncbi:MAG: biopolymer transporter ExbD [Sphingobium sp.]|nr:biopolymer transporter ExbD [Sphingobium sp.]MCP5398956.1 biopolymer transporter ExbD [Sphingomonas sp.]